MFWWREPNSGSDPQMVKAKSQKEQGEEVRRKEVEREEEVEEGGKGGRGEEVGVHNGADDRLRQQCSRDVCRIR